jgi:FAD/FMN-containing dehydrogenase
MPPAPDPSQFHLQLGDDLRARVVARGDLAYDKSRAVFFRGFDCRPAAIVRAADATDVSRVVSLARDTGLELAVRGGGHSYAGHGTCDGGIVLDLSQMRALDIDVEGSTAWAETGLTAGAYTAAVGAHGLATGFGDTGSVGIGGITLGGGVGYLARKHGLTIDDLLAAELVTADGRLLRVDAERHRDLFWAIRGGGGNFGVATRFKFRLHELDQVVAGMLMLPATPDLIVAFVAQAEAAPDELSTIANVMLAPPIPLVPVEHHGRPVVIAQLVHADTRESAERAIAPFRALASAIADTVRPMPYPAIFAPADGGPQPVAAAMRNMFVDAVDRRTAQTMIDHLRRSSAPMAATQLRVLGGAIGRVSPASTAFAHRRRRVLLSVTAMYERVEEAPVHEAWATRFAAALNEREVGAYVGFLGDDSQARVHEAYPGSTWDRLVAIKRRYDPTNVFRLNHNIPPGH